LGYSARRHALNDHIASADLGIAAEIGEGESASVAERPVFDLGGARPAAFLLGDGCRGQLRPLATRRAAMIAYFFDMSFSVRF